MTTCARHNGCGRTPQCVRRFGDNGLLDVEDPRLAAEHFAFLDMGPALYRALLTGTLNTRFALHVTVDDQRITRYHVYEDSYAVAQAYFGDPGP